MPVNNIINDVRVERFDSNPLITSNSSSTLGENINGPSVIQVPTWIENPLGKYYMYFAHHGGTHIRLAYANKLDGPWHIHEPGTLRLEDAGAFQHHIASPDVHIDEDTKQIRMYFHGPVRDIKGQWSGVATSSNGVDFFASPEILGKFYFRVWRWEECYYALAKSHNEGWGELYRSEDGLSAFRSRGDFLPGMRHAAVMIHGHHLLVFYSRIGDAPERILVASVDMRPDWLNWKVSEPVEVMRSRTHYEGVGFPLEPSKTGAAIGVRQLRDPCVFVDDETMLFYTVAGECGIAGSAIRWNLSEPKADEDVLLADESV